MPGSGETSETGCLLQKLLSVLEVTFPHAFTYIHASDHVFSSVFMCFTPQLGFSPQSLGCGLRIFNSSFLSWLSNHLMNRVHCFSPMYRHWNHFQDFVFSPRVNNTAMNIFMDVSLGACRGNSLGSMTNMELLARGECILFWFRY